MKVAVLTGGVGGAKLVLGLSRIVPAADLTAIVNVGDDFRHLGLHVSPDIDTLLYTLSGKANAAQGWGREGESWAFLEAVRELGGEDWFLLGDRDMALHVLRSAGLARGEPLSAIVARFARAWGLELAVLPASDAPLATVVETDEGTLPFQTYFVARRCTPQVRAIRFEGAGAPAAPGVIAAIMAADAVLIAPSNPWLSVDPVLAVAGVAEALRATAAPVVAVSPIVGGEAVKGPTAKIMRELGLPVTNASIAAHYAGLIDGLLVHDEDSAPRGPVAVARADTLMRTEADKVRVARAALDLAEGLRRA